MRTHTRTGLLTLTRTLPCVGGGVRALISPHLSHIYIQHIQHIILSLSHTHPTVGGGGPLADRGPEQPERGGAFHTHLRDHFCHRDQ